MYILQDAILHLHCVFPVMTTTYISYFFKCLIWLCNDAFLITKPNFSIFMFTVDKTCTKCYLLNKRNFEVQKLEVKYLKMAGVGVV